jgi:TetR/AcrR family transcriptional regulator
VSRTSTTAGRREQRRVAQHQVSREQILDAAEEVFGRKGFHAATLKEVAELAEFSVGSVYSFFTNKDDLFAQIFVRRGDEFMPGMRAVLATDEAPCVQLHSLAQFQIEFFRRHPQFGRLFLRASGTTNLRLDPSPDDLVRARFVEAMTLQTELFRRGQERGELRAGDPEVLAHLFSGVVASYQSCDPVVVDDARAGTERLPLDELHDILDAAFAPVPTGATGGAVA